MLPIVDQYLLFIQSFFLYINAITEVPTNVAVQYNHRSAHTPDNNAGASERADSSMLHIQKPKTKYLIQQYLR